MDYIITFESFNSNKYTNISADGEYYQVPFSLFDKEDICLGDEYLLCFGNSDFFYDYITDDEISKALKLDLSDINIDKGWENYTKDIFASDNKEYHIKRIAKLINIIKSGEKIKPILLLFDERSYEFAPNYIEDGNHRIRALKYLKYDYFPAYIHGSHSRYLIKYLTT